MSGDWIKFEVCTFDKPEVVAIADLLDISEQHVVGCLLWVWSWFDQHTEDGRTRLKTGNACSVTKTFIDRRVSVTGFADAMQKVGWLVQHDDGVTIPAFDKHNGKSAKKRALTARRVAKSKSKTGNAEVTQQALPREEKRRDKSSNSRGSSNSSARAREGESPSDCQDDAGCSDRNALVTELARLRFAHADVHKPKFLATLREWIALGVAPQDLADVTAMLRQRENKQFGPSYIDRPLREYLEAKRNGHAGSKRTGGKGARRSSAENMLDAIRAYAATDPGEVDSSAVREDAGALRPKVVEFLPGRDRKRRDG